MVCRTTKKDHFICLKPEPLEPLIVTDNSMMSDTPQLLEELRPVKPIFASLITEGRTSKVFPVVRAV